MIKLRGKRRLIVSLVVTGVYAVATLAGVPLDYIKPLVEVGLPVIIGGITATDLTRIWKEYDGIPED